MGDFSAYLHSGISSFGDYWLDEVSPAGPNYQPENLPPLRDRRTVPRTGSKEKRISSLSSFLTFPLDASEIIKTGRHYTTSKGSGLDLCHSSLPPIYVDKPLPLPRCRPSKDSQEKKNNVKNDYVDPREVYVWAADNNLWGITNPRQLSDEVESVRVILDSFEKASSVMLILLLLSSEKVDECETPPRVEFTTPERKEARRLPFPMENHISPLKRLAKKRLVKKRSFRFLACTGSGGTADDPDYTIGRSRKVQRAVIQKPIKQVVQANPEVPVVPASSNGNFDYSKVNVPAVLVPAMLSNRAKNEPIDSKYVSKLVTLFEQDECRIERTIFKRESLKALEGLHDNVIYERNKEFSPNAPYQQEFTRIELCADTKRPIPSSRSALCAFCEDLNFYELKNSSYSQHMCHTHGIFTNNYLTPDPLFLGCYKVQKPIICQRKTNRRARQRQAVVCPVCYDVIEIRCWKSKLDKNPFSNYLRHFKKEHRAWSNQSSPEKYFSLTRN